MILTKARLVQILLSLFATLAREGKFDKIAAKKATKTTVKSAIWTVFIGKLLIPIILLLIIAILAVVVAIIVL